jgi:hypothetical protein
MARVSGTSAPEDGDDDDEVDTAASAQASGLVRSEQVAGAHTAFEPGAFVVASLWLYGANAT